MGKFIIKENENTYEYSFELIAGNGQTILKGDGYSTRAACLNGIESVKRNSLTDDRFQLLESSNGKYYFRLKAQNGQIIGTSAYYESNAARMNGAESVKRNAPDAVVEQ